MVIGNYSQAQYYRDFYKGNDAAKEATGRSSMSAGSLVRADSTALTRSVQAFTKLYENKDLNGKDVYNAILAFGDTFNNALDSSKDTPATRVTQLRKGLQGLSSKQKKAMEAIGITVQGSGKLSIDKEKLADASPNKVKAVFGSDSDFLKELKKYARSLGNESSTIDLMA